MAWRSTKNRLKQSNWTCIRINTVQKYSLLIYTACATCAAPITMLKLTARQEQILNLIRDAINNTGFPPTRAEIAAELGFRSANAAEEHLQALARKGAIEISPGTSPAIRLLDKQPQPGARAERSTGRQLALPHPALMQLNLPLVGRVAAGSPILAQEHIQATYTVAPALFSAKPDYLLKVR